MAIGNIGQRIPLVLKVTNAAGEPARIDGDPVWAVDFIDLAEVRVDGESTWLYLLAAGSAVVSVEVDADMGAGTRLLRAEGLVVINDPAAEAQTVELVLGEAEDVPPQT